LRIDIAALRFMTPDVAVEDGMTSVLTPDGRRRAGPVTPSSTSRRTAVVSRQRPRRRVRPPTNYEPLKELEWTVGEWADEAAKGEVARAAFAWSPSQNFLTSTYTTTFKNTAVAAARSGSVGTGGQAHPLLDVQHRRRLRRRHLGAGGCQPLGDHVHSRPPRRQEAVATIVLTRVDADTMTWHAGAAPGREVIPTARRLH